MTAEPSPGGQHDLVHATEPRVLAIGGPGSGKTRTALLYARRVLEEEPRGSRRRVLFLTFSRAAVGELLDRSPDLLPADLVDRVDVSTFHGYARRLLDGFGRFGGRGTEPVLVSSEAEGKLRLARRGALTFDELIPAALRLLEADGWLARRVAARHAAVICDEFQDTDADQYALLEATAATARLVCLADPEQMIYDFSSRPTVGRARVRGFRESGAREVRLEARSFRDPSGLIPAVAEAVRERRLDDPSIGTARDDGRVRVMLDADPLWSAVVAEVETLRRSDHRSVGVFVSQRRMVAELATVFGEAGLEHEIAGLDAAAGDAAVALAAMGLFATGQEDWGYVRERLAVFLVAAQTKRGIPRLVEQLVSAPATLPDGAVRLMDRLQRDLAELQGEPTRGLFEVATRAMSRFWGQRLWRLGVLDLYGRVLTLVRHPLTPSVARSLAAAAARRQADAALEDLGLPRLPVRLMTMHQAKGREMDAIILVHHPDDIVVDTRTEYTRLSRLHYVVVARARRTVSIILPADANPFYSAYGAMAAPG